ncbi:hypothetical protein [Luteibacter sp. Lutesp34]|uniref:hypothetical protein n=1 Tax=Luteibacter sp. Lutesp34 TaxID=3243030 RepID=UPI0039B5F2C7
MTSIKQRLPQLITRLGTSFIVVSCLAALPARADWRVVDNTAAGKIDTSNKKLDSLSNRFNLGAYDNKKPGTRMENPAEVLPKAADAAATLDDGVHCDTVAADQKETCKKIVAIENAQYKYMLTVYETSAVRDQTLRDLLSERSGLSANDYGKLEDNTNKLTALYNLIALDRQQMEAVNYAYEANLRYLRALQAQKAESAQSGAPAGKTNGIDLPGLGSIDVGDIIKSLTTGAVLQAALDGSQSTEPPNMQRLQIGRSDSWW